MCAREIVVVCFFLFVLFDRIYSFCWLWNAKCELLLLLLLFVLMRVIYGRCLDDILRVVQWRISAPKTFSVQRHSDRKVIRSKPMASPHQTDGAQLTKTKLNQDNKN